MVNIKKKKCQTKKKMFLHIFIEIQRKKPQLSDITDIFQRILNNEELITFLPKKPKKVWSIFQIYLAKRALY